nr:hemagglutinin repeat-containing protein [Halomonas socia]
MISLVPQAYVRIREGDLQGDGTLIAGNSLALDVKNDIRNTGTLAGRELVSLTAENIANLGGRIGGNRVDLDARNDLDNIGGQITAGDSLALQAGRDLTLSSTSERLAGLYVTEAGGRLSATAGRDLSVVGADLDSAGDLRLGAGRDLDITSTLVSEQVNRGYRLSSTEIERAATLSAGNDLILDAGRDLTLTAVDVSAQGSGLLSAGRDLSLETLTTQESLRSWRNTTRESEEIGTQLEIGGSLALLAGQDITARAARLDAGDDLTLSAGRDISLDAGRSQQYDETRRGRTHTIDSQTRVQSTTLDVGGDLALQAGNDITLTAAQLHAGGDASLLAGNRIDLLTSQEEDYSLYEYRRRGGLLSSSRHQRDEVHDTRDVGTQIGAGDDIAIVSGGDQSYRGARLDAGQAAAARSPSTWPATCVRNPMNAAAAMPSANRRGATAVPKRRCARANCVTKGNWPSTPPRALISRSSGSTATPSARPSTPWPRPTPTPSLPGYRRWNDVATWTGARSTPSTTAGAIRSPALARGRPSRSASWPPSLRAAT